MTKTSLLAATAIAVGLATSAVAEEGTAPVYLLANLSIGDFEEYMAQYGAPVTPQLLAAGAEIIVATPQVDVLEGSYTPNWSVVVRFPDKDAAMEWYNSDEYQVLIPVRKELTDEAASTMVLAPQFEMPAE